MAEQIAPGGGDIQYAVDMLSLLISTGGATVYGTGDSAFWTICGQPYRDVRNELLRQIQSIEAAPGERRSLSQRFPAVTSFNDVEPKYLTPLGILTAKQIEETAVDL